MNHYDHIGEANEMVLSMKGNQVLNWLKKLFKTEIVTRHGDWYRAKQCHCGAVGKNESPICLECGCAAIGVEATFRWEWEQPSGGGPIASILMESRTRRRVRWHGCSESNNINAE